MRLDNLANRFAGIAHKPGLSGRSGNGAGVPRSRAGFEFFEQQPYLQGGGHWDFRFWLFFRSVFRFLCQKTSVFRFWCPLRFAGFSFFSIWFSVFVKNTSGFSVLLSDVLFGFFFFVPFGFRFFLDLSGN